MASGITETQITQVKFITNYANNNAKLHFDDIKVYLDNEYEPSTIYGLYPILKSRVSKEDSLALIRKTNVYTGTTSRTKTYTITMGNACTNYCDPNYLKNNGCKLPLSYKGSCSATCFQQAGCPGW